MTLITVGSRTDVGRVRKNNQDNLTTVVGDALGGRADPRPTNEAAGRSSDDLRDGGGSTADVR